MSFFSPFFSLIDRFDQTTMVKDPVGFYRNIKIYDVCTNSKNHMVQTAVEALLAAATD